MSKTLPRIVAFLLVPCLVIDPVTAAGLAATRAHDRAISTSPFESQAIVPLLAVSLPLGLGMRSENPPFVRFARSVQAASRKENEGPTDLPPAAPEDEDQSTDQLLLLPFALSATIDSPSPNVLVALHYPVFAVAYMLSWMFLKLKIERENARFFGVKPEAMQEHASPEARRFFRMMDKLTYWPQKIAIVGAVLAAWNGLDVVMTFLGRPLDSNFLFHLTITLLGGALFGITYAWWMPRIIIQTLKREFSSGGNDSDNTGSGTPGLSVGDLLCAA